MRASVAGARPTFALVTLTLATSVVPIAASGSSSGATPASPGPPKVTFSPRSSLARLDLIRGEVRGVAIGRFFAVADPTVSASGQLAFVSSRCASCEQRLTVMHGRRAAIFGQATSVAPLNKGRLLVSAGRGEDTEIRLVDRNGHGNELEWLTRSAERIGIENEKELVVSPNRRMLLFSGEGRAEHHGNYVADLLRHRLLPLAGEAESAPAFSPDGRTIAYQNVSRRGDWDLCVARISLRAVSHERCFRSPGSNDRQPAFMANGRTVVFSSDRASRRSGVSSLYLLDLRTGSVRRLTRGRYDATSPAVAPDGRSVIFVRRALVPLR
jgi:dipeptidyl aminopeptidase/acylaminoacyl peptidase